MDEKVTKEVRERLDAKMRREDDWMTFEQILAHVAAERALAVEEYKRGLAGEQAPELEDAEQALRVGGTLYDGEAQAIVRELDRLRVENSEIASLTAELAEERAKVTASAEQLELARADEQRVRDEYEKRLAQVEAELAAERAKSTRLEPDNEAYCQRDMEQEAEITDLKQQVARLERLYRALLSGALVKKGGSSG